MRRIQLSFLLMALLMLGVAVPTTMAQHKVLFESFTNSFDGCPMGNTFDGYFKSTMSQYGSKVIHLNYHIGNVGDPMAQAGTGTTQTTLALGGSTSGGQMYVFYSAVDRTPFDGQLPRGTSDESTWESRIGDQANKPSPATLTLSNATYDPLSSTLYADVNVTATRAISDTIYIHYAITQDSVLFDQCNGTGPGVHNDVVRYVTFKDSVALLPGTASGGTTVTHWQQRIRTSDPRFVTSHMRLVAFLVESSTHDVVNAAVLKSDFDTLQVPPVVLSIDDSTVNGKVYAPGDIAMFTYTSSNLLYADAFYSLDNGTSWHGFTTVGASPVSWTVPDSATTTGKFKLVGPNGAPVSIQSGNFTISVPTQTLTLLHPGVDDTAFTSHNYSIVWSMLGIDSVKLEYSLDGGASWTLIASDVKDTFYVWNVPNIKTNQALIRITPLGVTGVPSVTSPAFTINSTAGVTPAVGQRGFGIVSAYPNPVNQGSLHLSLTSNTAHVLVEVLDLLGRPVFSRSYSDVSNLTLPLGTLTAGSYIVRASDGTTTASKHIVIR